MLFDVVGQVEQKRMVGFKEDGVVITRIKHHRITFQR
jgi:hypothetical protein